MCQNSQGLVSHYILHLNILPHWRHPKHAKACWCAVVQSWGDPKEGGVEVGTPAAADLQTRCLLHRFGSRGSTIHHPWSVLALGLAVSGPASLLTLSSCSLGTGHTSQGSCSVICWHAFSSSLSPMIVQTWEPVGSSGSRNVKQPGLLKLEGNGAGI